MTDPADIAKEVASVREEAGRLAELSAAHAHRELPPRPEPPTGLFAWIILLGAILWALGGFWLWL